MIFHTDTIISEPGIGMNTQYWWNPNMQEMKQLLGP